MKRSFLLITCMLLLLFPIFAYAEDSAYYFVYRNIDDELTVEISKQTLIQEDIMNKISLENLDLVNGVYSEYIYTPVNVADYDELSMYIRLVLLSSGNAKIINVNLATNEEISAQEKAKKEKKGLWIEGTDMNTSEDERNIDEGNSGLITIAYKEFIDFIGANWEKIIGFLISLGLGTFLINKVVKFFRTRRITLFIGGDKAAGKTTLKSTIIHPDMSDDELKNYSPTRTPDTQRIIRDDENRKLTLDAKIIDIPGDDYHEIINFLSSSNVTDRKYSIVIVVAHNQKPLGDVDEDFVDDQLMTIKKLWSAVLKANAIIKPKNLILFVNKLDLEAKERDLRKYFNTHEELLRKVCKEKGINFERIDGSAVKRNGIQRLVNILKEK